MNTKPAFRTPCPLWAEKLAATHPDDLSPSERSELQAHLATCPTCTAIRAEYEVMGAVISQLPTVDAGPGMPPGLLHVLRTQGNHAAWTPPIPENVIPLPLSPALPAHTVPHGRKRLIPAFVQTLAAVLIIGALLGSFLVLFTSHHTRTGQPHDTRTWHIIPSPNPGAGTNFLLGVAALSANDAWAIGFTSDSSTLFAKTTRTLVEHWNGSQWSIVPSPNTTSTFNLLAHIVAHSPNDVWAIGTSFDESPSSSNQPLIEHWNGSQWSIFSLPKTIQRPNMQSNMFNQVTFISPNDIWAVGTSTDTYGHHSMTLVEHWNGSQWSIIPSPNPGLSRNELHGVVVISANDIWAVGLFHDGNSPTLAQTLIEHWNGSRWSVVPTPTVGTSYNSLNAISATSANDIWTVGSSSSDLFLTTQQTLIEHWDGTSWHIVKSPTVGASDVLDEVIAISANNAWAPGTVFQASNQATDVLPGFILHWDGSQWSVAQNPNAGSGIQTTVTDIVPVPDSNSTWAVGYYDHSNSPRTSTFTALYYS